MHTMTIKLTDLEYKSIAEEAEKQKVSPEQIIDKWLIEGEQETVPFNPSADISALSPYTEEEIAEEEHNNAERRALSKWHESLAKRIRSRRPS